MHRDCHGKMLKGMTGKHFKETREQEKYLWQLHYNGWKFSLYMEAIQIKGEDASMKMESV